MSMKESFEFSVDDILAEFKTQEEEKPVPETVKVPARPSQPARPAPQLAPETVRPPRQERPVPQPAQETVRLPVQERPAPRPTQEPVRPARPEAPEEADPPPDSLVGRAVRGLFALAFAVAAGLILCWMVLNVHPDTQSGSSASLRLDLLARLNTYANNAASDALGDLAYIPKHYSIAETATVAPAPDPAKFGSTADPMEILAVIESASELLAGQEVIFDPNADFQPGQEIRYYCDETILVIAWREILDGKLCTFAEIKLHDGSQLRRKLAGDTYGSSTELYATAMAADANAVIAINGDFYVHRNMGITVYQRQVNRFRSADKLDSCFFTASGDLLFAYAGTFADQASVQQFVDENDVLFGLTFGPILVDNGQARTISRYPLGEIDDYYSRAAIGTTDELHYLLMTVNMDKDAGYGLPCTVNQAAQFIAGKGCFKAYALDGGQTATIAMQGTTVNRVDYGYERTMSDILYFATALPEQEEKQ